jgi:prophage regulatory protein
MAEVLISHADLTPKGITYSKPHLWRLEKENKFPKRVPVGPGRYGYVESEIDSYIDDLIAKRDAGVAKPTKARHLNKKRRPV